MEIHWLYRSKAGKRKGGWEQRTSGDEIEAGWSKEVKNHEGKENVESAEQLVAKPSSKSMHSKREKNEECSGDEIKRDRRMEEKESATEG